MVVQGYYGMIRLWYWYL